MKTKILIASSNPHKVEKITEMLKGLDLDIQTLKDLPPLADAEQSWYMLGDAVKNYINGAVI